MQRLVGHQTMVMNGELWLTGRLAERNAIDE
jgi:hypothetical protein